MSTISRLSRRGFLRGKRTPVDVIRPPGSSSEEQFTDQCQRCGDCVNVCETGVLVKGDAGFPEMNFNKAGCSFCHQCISTCEHQALNIRHQLTVQPEINTQCLATNRVHCRTCQEFCEVEAIAFQLAAGGIALPQIDSNLCTGCGECVSGCPVNAIKMIQPEPKYQPEPK